MLNIGISGIGLIPRRMPKASLNFTAKEVLSAERSEPHKAKMSQCYLSRRRTVLLLTATEQPTSAELRDQFGFNWQRLGKHRSHGVRLTFLPQTTTIVRCGYISLSFGSVHRTGRQSRLQSRTTLLGIKIISRTRSNMRSRTTTSVT